MAERGDCVVLLATEHAHGDAALRRAAARAEALGVPLVVLRVWRDADRLFGLSRREVPDLVRSQAADAALVARRCGEARAAHPHLDIRGRLARGGLTSRVRAAAAGARLVVVSTSQPPGRPGAVAQWCLGHLAVPVEVVTDEPVPPLSDEPDESPADGSVADGPVAQLVPALGQPS